MIYLQNICAVHDIRLHKNEEKHLHNNVLIRLHRSGAETLEFAILRSTQKPFGITNKLGNEWIKCNKKKMPPMAMATKC